MLRIGDSHGHVNPVKGIGPRKLAKRFVESGGWLYGLVNLLSWSLGVEVRGADDYRRLYDATVRAAEEMRREGLVVPVILGPHPAETAKLIARGVPPRKAVEVSVEAYRIAANAAQYCYTPENPFTAGERVEMIRLALGELYSRCYLVPIDNVANNALWLRHLSLRTPSFEAVFTNNELVRMLAELEGYRVEPIPLLKREAYEGRVIRKLMTEGGGWRDLVPKEVAEFLDRIRAEERLRRLARTEPIPLPER